MNFVVPMYESERGWGAKIDGYAGPFNTVIEAEKFVAAFNLKNNSENDVPDYYIAALSPVVYRNQKCNYKSII